MLTTDKPERPARPRSLVPWIAGAVILVLVAGIAAAVAPFSPKPVTATIPSGATVVARLERTVSTESARVGDQVRLTARDEVSTTDGPAVPAGMTLIGEVTHARGGGSVAGAPELTIRITAIEVSGDNYPASANPLRFKGKNDALESAAEIGGGAVVGAILGEIVGKEPVGGAVIGAAAGTVVAVATKGDQIVLPAGTMLRIRLTDGVEVTFRPEEGDADRESNG